MKKIIVVPLFLLASLTADAADHDVVWSDYSGNLKLVAFHDEESAAEFQGQEILRGRLYFEFDMTGDDMVDGVLFAKLVPDSNSLAKLPFAIAGFYPSKIDYISLINPERALDMIVGTEEALRLSHGKKPEVSFDVEVVIDLFQSSVECDARHYFAQAISIRLTGHKYASIDHAPHGC